MGDGFTLHKLAARQTTESAYINDHGKAGPFFVCVECGTHSIPLYSAVSRMSHYESTGHINEALRQHDPNDMKKWTKWASGKGA